MPHGSHQGPFEALLYTSYLFGHALGMLSHSSRISAQQLSLSLLPINLGQVVLNKVSSCLGPKWSTLSLHLPFPFLLPLELFPSRGHSPYLFLLVMICWGIGKHGKMKGRANFSFLTSLTKRTYAYHPCVSSREDWILHFSQWLGFFPCLPLEAPSCSIDGSSCPPIPDSLDEGEKGRKQTVTFTWFFLLTGAMVSIVSVSVSLVSQDFPSSEVSSSHPPRGVTLGTMWALTCSLRSHSQSHRVP